MSLFICATPIGNLSDTSTRLIETLSSVDHIVAEDTRVTLKLLQRFNIKKPLSALEKYNEKAATEHVMTLLKKSQNVALVSDAGTPGISDPGAYCVAECVRNGFHVIPIPGPSAVATLLSASGLLSDTYSFTGFFPKKESERETWASKWGRYNHPIVFFETSPRLLESIHWLIQNMPLTYIVLGKELTKQFETILHTTPETVLEKLSQIPIKGEWCIAIQCVEKKEDRSDDYKLINNLKSAGFTHKDIKKIAECFGYNKNDWYKQAIQ